MISWIVQGVIGLATNYLSHQKTKVELKRKAEIAKLEAETKIREIQHEKDLAMMDADSFSEKNRQKSIVDEVMLLVLAVFFVYSILDPVGAKVVLEAFMSYPIWLQIIYIGVFVSIFGLRGMFDSIGGVLTSKK